MFQQMASLPAVKAYPTGSFACSGVKYAGPISLLFSKGKGVKSVKGYITFFIWLVARAVHVKIVSDITTQGFLAASARFTNQRQGFLFWRIVGGGSKKLRISFKESGMKR